MTKGIILNIEQVWFGHKCKKETKLYIVGAKELPRFKVQNTEATHYISSFARPKDRKNYKTLPECGKAQREKTPEQLAKWLVKLCQSI